MKCGRAKWQEVEETRRDFNIVLIHQGKKFLISELFKDIQFRTTSSIPNDFSECIYHIGCEINLRSIPNSGLIPGGQNLSQRQDGALHVCGSCGQKKSNYNFLGVGIKLAQEKIFYVLSETIERSYDGNWEQTLKRRYVFFFFSTSSLRAVSVERLDVDKDADENVDADQITTGRLVKSEQSIGLFTQHEEIDIDFRISGLPQTVVRTFPCSRTREEDRESSSSRITSSRLAAT